MTMQLEQCDICSTDLEESQIGLCEECQYQNKLLTSRNAQFLSVIDGDTKSAIVQSIADHYGITAEQAFAEVTDEQSEHLLDYMVEPERSAASALMQRHGMLGW